MQATERIEGIAQQCRAGYYKYPESLITAICQYLTGADTLSDVQQEWRKAKVPSYGLGAFIIISDPKAACLDEIDLRVLDICTVTGCITAFFQHIAVAGPVEQARDYLLAKGMTTQEILSAIVECGSLVSLHITPDALGRLLLSYIPEHFDELRAPLSQTNSFYARKFVFWKLITKHKEGSIDLAWQIAQIARHGEADEYAAALLKADPARFTEWARQVARNSIQNSQLHQYPTLAALLELDPAQYIDLALDAARAPAGPYARYRWSRAILQRLGLDAAYRFDPVKYLPLVEEAAVAPNTDLAKHAVELLKQVDFEQARPILQRCIAEGDTEAALQALEALLEHPWPERQAYMLSLLPHRSKQIRDALIKWLAQEGESVIEPLAPYLAHSNADARLAAIQALQHIGSEQVRSLLAARLDVEKSLKVKQAILDVVGVAALADATRTDDASPIEALTAEAEAALKRVAKPALLWFDPAHIPTLCWKDGRPLPPAVLNYLLYRQSRIKDNTLDARVAEALTLIDRSGLSDLARMQFNGWMGQGAKSEHAWCLPLVCVCADERLIHPLRQSIDGWVKAARGALAAKAVGAMALIESDLALAEINDLAEHVKHSQVKAAAQKALTDAAAHRNITLEELSDLIVPALGFDEHGERVFDYGSRQFTAHLRLDQTLQLTDSAGKRITMLPRPGARDDESKARAAQAAWSLLKRQTPLVIKMQTQRLENALTNQRAWRIDRWQALFLKHPVLRSFAIVLVWGVVTPGQTTFQALFRPLEDGSLTDTEDNAVTLPAQGRIRMVHPVELDEEIRGAWLQHLADYEVAPSFPQLNRPIVPVSPDECAALWWEKYKGYLMNGAALKGRYMKAGWERGSVQDGGAYYTIWKAFPAAGIQAVLETAGMSVGYEKEFSTAIKRLAFARVDTIKRGSYIYDDLKEQDERLIKLGDVPPIIFSEIAADVQTFAATGEYTEDWEKKVW
ncbi:MAG TPA: DUF4132 domain-containing protein [Ktedonobacterales bacterium]|jgi:hypothetical protein